MTKHELPLRPTPVIATESPHQPASPAPPPDSATISAAPQLRDLRKEATAFVPRGVKRKKLPAGGMAIDAAPGAGQVDEDGDKIRSKSTDSGGLMGKLHGMLGGMKRDDKAASGGGDEDYQKFLEGLGDLA